MRVSDDSLPSISPRPLSMKISDDLLPPTGSRNSKWWYSTIHNATAMIGAGVLAFPFSMAYLRWGGGMIALISSWIITLYTLWQMVEMHEVIPDDPEMPRKRYDRYHELGQAAFGKRLGLWIVVPQQIMVEVGVDIVYMITGGYSLQKFHQLVKCPEQVENLTCGRLGIWAWILIFASQHFVLAQLPDFNSLSGLSLAAALMSVSYTTIAWSDVVSYGRVSSDYGKPAGPTADLVFGTMKALGIVAFAFAGHNVVLEIQSTMPSTKNKPSKVDMWRGVRWAYFLVAVCYFPVAIAGYWAYGNQMSQKQHKNILLVLNRPRGLIAVANMMVIIHMTGSYQVYAMPMYDLLETTLIKKFYFRSSLALRLVTRSSYVYRRERKEANTIKSQIQRRTQNESKQIFTALVACTLPFFDDLLAFFGGFAFTPTTYYLPCIIWLRLKKPKIFSWSWCINWVIIIIGILLSIVSTVGGFRYILEHSKHYHFYEVYSSPIANSTTP